MHDTTTYNIVAINSTYSKSLNSTLHINPPSPVGSTLGLKSKGRSFEPVVNHYFSSKNVRLLAHVFTGEDPQTEWMKRDESNSVYWFQPFIFKKGPK